MKHFRELGCIVHKAEHWNAHAGIRQDAFGIGDLLVAGSFGFGIALVQATSASNVSARVNKAKASVYLKHWLMAGGRFIVQGWHNRKDQDAKLKRNLPAPDLIERELTLANWGTK